MHVNQCFQPRVKIESPRQGCVCSPGDTGWCKVRARATGAVSRAASAACFPFGECQRIQKVMLARSSCVVHPIYRFHFRFHCPSLPFSLPSSLHTPTPLRVYERQLVYSMRYRHMEGNGACPHCSPHSPFPRCCASRRAGRSSLGSSSWRSRPSPSAAATQDQGPRHRPDPPAAIGPRRQDRGCRAPPGRSQASPKAVDVGSELSFYELRW